MKPGKHLSFRAPGQVKFTRLRSLGDGYCEQEIYAVIKGKKPLSPSRSKAAQQEPQGVNLLVDIQAKLQAGKGPGYERWAKVSTGFWALRGSSRNGYGSRADDTTLLCRLPIG